MNGALAELEAAEQAFREGVDRGEPLTSIVERLEKLTLACAVAESVALTLHHKGDWLKAMRISSLKGQEP